MGECVKEAKGKKTEGEYVKCSAGRKICQMKYKGEENGKL